jgi:hypothetical protein
MGTVDVVPQLNKVMVKTKANKNFIFLIFLLIFLLYQYCKGNKNFWKKQQENAEIYLGKLSESDDTKQKIIGISLWIV